MVGLEFSKVTFREQQNEDNLLETYEFINYEYSAETMTLENIFRTICQIIVQNCFQLFKKLNICEIQDSVSFISAIKNILENEPLVEVTYTSIKTELIKQRYDVLILTDKQLSVLNKHALTDLLTEEGFIIYHGSLPNMDTALLEVITTFNSTIGDISLLRPMHDFMDKPIIINVETTNFKWVNELKINMEKQDNRTIYLLAKNEQLTGILGLTNCLMRKECNVKFRTVLLDSYCDTFAIDSSFYRKQLSKNLVFNILKDNKWGTYIYKPIKLVPFKEVENASVYMSTAREFSTLKWMETPLAFQR